MKQALRHAACVWLCAVAFATFAVPAAAAPYAAMVVDARSGKVLHSRNADTRLHPASLTKMMTLYVVFGAVERGEISLDTPVYVSRNAAAEPASKLYLKQGSHAKLRYLIRASAVKSANDAATAMAEAISGSEEAFARRMTQTARALGMSKTTFKNAHGLTQSGHLSTARDMTTMGRALFFHFPEYYHLFKRRSITTLGKTVRNTNRRLLNAYDGADGIKTGYTRAAGFNLVASAKRGQERVIATMFGGSTGAARNKRVAELLDMGFERAATRVSLKAPGRPNLSTIAQGGTVLAVSRSARPSSRPLAVARADAASPNENEDIVTQIKESVEERLREVQVAAAASTSGVLSDAAPATAPEQAQVADPPAAETTSGSDAATTVAAASAAGVRTTPPATATQPEDTPSAGSVRFSSRSGTAPTDVPVSPQPRRKVVARMSTSDSSDWGIAVGTFNSRYEAERVLLRTALSEVETLDTSRRKVVKQPTGYVASFLGMNEQSAALACQRLQARDQPCETLRR